MLSASFLKAVRYETGRFLTNALRMKHLLPQGALWRLRCGVVDYRVSDSSEPCFHVSFFLSHGLRFKAGWSCSFPIILAPGHCIIGGDGITLQLHSRSDS